METQQLEICIICDSKTNLKLMSSTECNENDGENVKSCFELFKNCFNLNFPKKNRFGMFNMLCSECIALLRQSYKFRKKSENAHMRLYEHLLDWNDDMESTSLSKYNVNEFNAEFKINIDDIKSEEMCFDESDGVTLEDLIVDVNPEYDIKSEDMCQVLEYSQVAVKERRHAKRKSKTKGKEKLRRKNKTEPLKIMDIIRKRHKKDKTGVVKKKIDETTFVVLDDEDGFSDCSTNTEEILIATGYYSKPNKQKIVSGTPPPVLKPGTKICPVCNEEFINSYVTYQHYVTHYPLSLCHLCGKAISSKNGFKQHMISHEKITDKHVCKPCNKVFKTQYTLRGHIKFTHKGIKAVTCYHCPKQFSGSLSRVIHMHKEHNIPCKFFHCNKCDLKFYSKGKLKNHEERVHARTLKFFCDVCSNGFLNRHELRNHIKYKHGDEADLPHCELCGRKFASPKGLKEHMKIHYNIKNYKCPHCEEAYVQKASLDCHLKKHFKT